MFICCGFFLSSKRTSRWVVRNWPGSPGKTAASERATRQWLQALTSLSPIGHEFAWADPQQYDIRRWRLTGRSPNGFTFGGGRCIGLNMMTTALSGTVRIRDGTKVRSSLTFSHGQYSCWSHPGGPAAGWHSSHMKATGLGMPRSRWLWVAASTQGNCITSFRLEEK